MDTLDAIATKVLAALEAKNAAREKALTASRKVTQHAALTIRAVHRGEFDTATELLTRARQGVQEMGAASKAYPDVYFAGYVQDALKEYAEANIVHALIQGEPLPDPDALGVEYAAYLNGLGEAAGELRRHALDLIRQGRTARGEQVLQMMEDIYSLLVSVDFPDAITGGLRRTTDMVRGVLERTRGDLTMVMKQEELRGALREFEDRLREKRGK